jgi:hypothetical protein
LPALRAIPPQVVVVHAKRRDPYAVLSVLRMVLRAWFICHSLDNFKLL